MPRFALIAALVALVSCGESPYARLDALRVEVCACKSVACANAVMLRIPKDAPTDRRAGAIARQMLDCVSELKKAAEEAAAETEQATAADGTDSGSGSGSALTRP